MTMKKGKLQNLSLTFLLIGLLGCGGVSQNEHDNLKAENEKLRKELEDLKFGPLKLLSQARLYADKADFNNARIELQNLLKKHPTSIQAKEANELLIIVENGIQEKEILEEKEKQEKELVEKERLAKATQKMRVSIDDINNITWYYDKTSPRFSNYNGLYAYIGKSEGSKPWLRLAIQYAADDWLFIEKYTIKVDDQTFYITENSYGEIKKDNGSGGIWEWLDRLVGNEEYEIIQAISKGKDVKIRFNGKDYRDDKTITLQQKLAIRNVLDAFEALGGTTVF